MQTFHELTTAVLEKKKTDTYCFFIKNVLIWIFLEILNFSINT